MRLALPLALTAALIALGAPEAAADGLPVVDLGSRPDSIAPPGSDQRVVVIPAGRTGTVVARVVGPRVGDSKLLPVEWSIPAVAYDGTPGGLAADGSRMALISPRERFPRKTTELVLLDRRLKVRRRIDLDGDFSFDAISPDGSALFLVEYPNPRDPSIYRVRVYDVAERRLEPEPLIDSRAAAIVMRGLPVTRATGGDGAVEYTLYDGLGDPFIHALDTVQRSALCIPLPKPRSRISWEMGLERAGRKLYVTDPQGAFAVVDTVANTARRPAPAPWASLTTVLTEVLRERV